MPRIYQNTYSIIGKNFYYYRKRKPSVPPPPPVPTYPEMIEPLTGMSGTILADYKILIMGGGKNVSASIKTNYILDLQYNIKTILTDMPLPSMFHAVDKLDENNIFICGGATNIMDDGQRYLSSYKFNIKNKVFEIMPKIQSAVERHSVNIFNNSAYVFGGVYGIGRGENARNKTGKIDLNTGVITILTDIPARRAGHSAFLKGNEVYLICGQNSADSNAWGKSYKYNIDLDTFQELATLSRACSCMCLIVWNNDTISIIGGYARDFERSNKQNTYNIGLNTWESKKDLNYVISDSVGGALSEDLGVIVGGRPKSDPSEKELNYTVNAVDTITFYDKSKDDYIYKI